MMQKCFITNTRHVIEEKISTNTEICRDISLAHIHQYDECDINLASTVT